MTLEGTERTSPGNVMTLQITNTELRLDTRISPSSEQESFIYFYFQKDWLPGFNLSYSPLSVKRLVVVKMG
jgi:hypothetical protein